MATTLVIKPEDDVEQLMKKHGITEVTVLNTRRRARIMTRDQVAKRLPVWLRRYKIALAVDSRKLTLAENDFLFKRTATATELKQVQGGINQTKGLIAQYQAQLATAQVRLNEVKEKMKGRVKGADPEEIRKEALTWPGVIDILFGPATDPVTGQHVAPGTFIITFLPVAYQGVDVGQPAGAWAVSNPIRFLVKEDGTVYGVGVTPLTTYQPHMLENRICTGNLMKPFGVMVRENNVLGAIGVLDEWRISHGEGHYQDHEWAGKAWLWWDEVFVHPAPKRKPKAWLFDGRWDGRTIQLSTKDGINTLTNIEEFFGGPLEAIVHVGTGKRYIKPEQVKAYVDWQEKNAKDNGGQCLACGRETKGCPCHKVTCSGCRHINWTCTCRPLTGFVPLPKTFIAADILYTVVAGKGYWCEHVMPNGAYCHADAIFTRRTAPTYLCEEHLPPPAKKHLDTLRKTAIATAENPLVPDPERGVTMRHNHKHTHGSVPNGHTHQHEHYRTDALDERIGMHDEDHTAYSKADGFAVRRGKHEGIK